MAQQAVSTRTITDMTSGSPFRLIFFFSLPLLAGNLLQQLYNMVDSVVVGNFIGDQALAAVGTGYPMLYLLSSIFMGIGMGNTIMISQFYGAGDMARVQKMVNTMYRAVLVSMVPFTLIGLLAAGPLLTYVMNVPDDGTLQLAKQYCWVVFLGLCGTMGFNLNSSILQGLGDSRTSLLFLSVSAVMNIVLDLLFTVGFGFGVMGVAAATAISQVTSWLFGIFYINRHYQEIRIDLHLMKFEKPLFLGAIKLGIPSCIQQSLFSLGIMMIMGLVSSYGSDFMAGFNGANKIDSFILMPIQSFATAMTTYSGQNVGAGNLKRVGKGLRTGIFMAVGFSILVMIVLYPMSGLLMRMFSRSQAVIDAGVLYLHCVLPTYCFLGINFMCNATLRGAGSTIIPMIGSVVELWGIRVPVAYLLSHFFGPQVMFFAYGIGWAVNILFGGTYYLSGRWKKKCVVKRMESKEETA